MHFLSVFDCSAGLSGHACVPPMKVAWFTCRLFCVFTEDYIGLCGFQLYTPLPAAHSQTVKFLVSRPRRISKWVLRFCMSEWFLVSCLFIS
jgi:hypothetical protein